MYQVISEETKKLSTTVIKHERANSLLVLVFCPDSLELVTFHSSLTHKYKIKALSYQKGFCVKATFPLGRDEEFKVSWYYQQDSTASSISYSPKQNIDRCSRHIEAAGFSPCRSIRTLRFYVGHPNIPAHDIYMKGFLQEERGKDWDVNWEERDELGIWFDRRRWKGGKLVEDTWKIVGTYKNYNSIQVLEHLKDKVGVKVWLRYHQV